MDRTESKIEKPSVIILYALIIAVLVVYSVLLFVLKVEGMVYILFRVFIIALFCISLLCLYFYYARNPTESNLSYAVFIGVFACVLLGLQTVGLRWRYLFRVNYLIDIIIWICLCILIAFLFQFREEKEKLGSYYYIFKYCDYCEMVIKIRKKKFTLGKLLFLLCICCFFGWGIILVWYIGGKRKEKCTICGRRKYISDVIYEYPDTIICPKCGEKTSLEANFCEKCGIQLFENI